MADLALTYPNLPDCIDTIEPEPFEDGVFVATSPAGIEVRRSQQDDLRWRWTITYAGLRPEVAAASSGSWASYSEIGAILYLLRQAKGRRKTFLFVDPLEGSTYTVRFEEFPKFTPQAGGTWYSATVKLISEL